VDTAYISAFSALGGAAIGGLASFGSSWLTQRTQLRFAHQEAIKAKREALYAEFIDEASRLYGDALGHQKDEVADLVKIYALIGRIRLVSPRPVVSAAERTLDTIGQTYLAPNRSLHEVMDDFSRVGSDFFSEFGEACRQDLGLDWAVSTPRHRAIPGSTKSSREASSRPGRGPRHRRPPDTSG
jgi:hypothetical protein